MRKMLIFAVFGPPSPSMMFVAGLVTEIVKQALGGVQQIVADSADNLKLSVSSRTSDNCVLTFTRPDSLVVQSIIQNRIPSLLVLETFLDYCTFVMDRESLDSRHAIQNISNCIACLYPVISQAQIHSITLNMDEAVTRLIGRLALMIGAPLDEAGLQAILNECFNGQSTITVAKAMIHMSPVISSFRELRGALSDEDQMLFDDLGNALKPLLSGAPVPSFRCPLSALLNAEPPHRPISGPLDLLGPARILTFGPYLHFPVGAWIVEVVFAVVDNDSGNTLMIDVYSSSGQLLAVAKGELPKGGTFKMRLPFVVEDTGWMIELRTYILSGAIEGRFELISLDFNLDVDGRAGVRGDANIQ